MKNLRFKRKTYGRGRVPFTWQGWVILALYLGAVVGRIIWYKAMAERDLALSSSPDSGGNLLVVLLPVVILTILLLIVCYLTGERPKWQRGEKR